MIDLKKENNIEKNTEFDELYSFTNSTINKDEKEIVNVTLDRDILRQLGYELLEIDNNIVGIKKDDQKITSLEIPALYDYNDNEYRITQVGDEVFKNCNILEEINLPTTVTKIGNKAFLGCKKLFSVHIPSSLKEIGDYAFLGCEHLTEIEIPNETKIGTNVFEDCKSLPYLIQKKFIIKSENVKEYEDNIYRQAKMDSVWGKIHTTTGYILIFISFIYCLFGNQKPAKMPWVDVFLAFFSGGCALIFIPLMLLLFIGKMRDLWPNKNEINNKTLERMGYKDKYSLTSIDIPKFYNISEKHTYTSRSNISSESQRYVEYTNYFYKITGIGKNAFKDCTNLTKVIIPDSVVKIDDQAFLNCTNLTEVVIPDSIKEIGNSVFSYCKNLKKLVIPDSVIKLGKFALYGLELNTLILPKRLEKEIDNAFLKNIENISYIALEDKYSEQNESPIFNVPQENKKIDRDVEKVKKEVVDNNYNWSNIETEKYINEQKQGMVMICALGSIFYIYVLFIILPVFFNLDKFLTYFITSIFALLCIKFSIDLYPTFDVLNDKLLKDLGLYRYKNTFRTFEIPPIYSSKNVRVSGRTFMITKIGNSAFKNCTNFKYIKIPETIKKIGTEAFSGCTGLVSLNIPDSVQEIGKDAFLGVNNVIYNGTATGSPWGAYNINAKGKISLTKEYITKEQEYEQKYLAKVEYMDLKEYKKRDLIFGIFIISLSLLVLFAMYLSQSIDIKTLLGSLLVCFFVIFSSYKAIRHQWIDKNELNDYTLKQLGYKSKIDITSIDIPEIYDSQILGYNNIDFMKKKYFITSIKEGLFKDCKNLKNVIISDSVSKIGAEAFSGCTEIDNIKIPDYVTEIGENAFLGVSNIIYNGKLENAPWGAKAVNGKLY